MALLRSTFIALSQNPTLRAVSERSAAGRKLSSRFVAGMDVNTALDAAAALNAQGITATLDSLGENVTTPEEAQRAAGIYHQLLEQIHARGLQANVSVKLTQMGMDLDPGLAEGIVRELTDHARAVDNFIRIDMEGTPYTQATLDLVRRIHGGAGNGGRIGIVIQAYLYRSQSDIARLMQEGIRVRLCKGAYQEPAEVAFPLKQDVDRNFVRLMQMLLGSGVYNGIATHDEAMIEATKDFARERKIPPSAFEFQMLYGIRRDLQQELVKQGYNMRVYIPFGTEWYPYFMRRLAERPANALFVARNLLKR